MEEEKPTSPTHDAEQPAVKEQAEPCSEAKIHEQQTEEDMASKAQTEDDESVKAGAGEDESSKAKVGEDEAAKVETTEDKSEETKEPMDWFEPLEDDDDDANSFDFSAVLGQKEAEEESLAGESEKSGSVAGSEKARKGYKRNVGRPRGSRQSNAIDDDWEDCPSLGEGWKRKERVRQSGTRTGQSDVYYMSPRGERARSRIELAIMLKRDLSSFEFKTGVFHMNGEQKLTLQRRKRKRRDHSSSDSSFVEREGAETPDSHHRLTPTLASKPVATHQAASATNSPTTLQIKKERTTYSPKETMKPPDGKIKLPGPTSTSSKPLSLPSVNGEFGSEDSTLLCARCGLMFTGTWYDKQRKKPLCPSCWSSKTKEHPMIRFRKWIPCGQCAGCHNKVNCGQCTNCKERSPENRKRTCRKRKCVCPIRKGPGGFVMPKPKSDPPSESSQDYSLNQPIVDIKTSDIENLITPLEMDDDDDASTDEDEEEVVLVDKEQSRKTRNTRESCKITGSERRKRRKRRSCGECRACLYTEDCGTCDFCIDKPKFGGSNKKRQKCRLRQCQRQAMRHLLPGSQLGPPSDGFTTVTRSKPQHTYSRKKKRVLPPSEEEEDDRNSNWSAENASSSKATPKHNVRKNTSMQLNNSVFEEQNGVTSDDNFNQMETVPSFISFSQFQAPVEDVEEDDYPTITQIYSLADEPEPSDMNKENDLMKLLTSLRASALPILWYAIMADGPQIQLVQCSKRSVMADTTVLINSDFNYKVLVQRHPLLATHPLYDTHPSLLNCVTHVVNLLLDLDKYFICHGVPPNDAVLSRSPVVLQRAPTCHFLTKKNCTICRNCKLLCD
ncbi:unnamed protein product [Knipowitschia caucasica]